MNIRWLRGWIFDVYAEPQQGAVVWFIDENGGRHRFTQPLPITFYAGGEPTNRDELASYLAKSRIPFREIKRVHLFQGEIDVLALRIPLGAMQRGIYRRLQELFPRLDYYDADLPLSTHYFASTGAFPLAFCTLQVNATGNILSVQVLDDRWSLKPKFPPVRALRIAPVGSPRKGTPSGLRLEIGNQTSTESTNNPRLLLEHLNQILAEFDPDIIHTRYGDSWLFPYLFKVAKQTRVRFNPNRDQNRAPIQVEPNQFESYGQPVFRDRQTLLLGRAHLDPTNSMAFDDWGLEGIFETARLSNLPLQNAARRSAGGAFVGMQVAASLKRGVLIPIRKKQSERFKSASQLLTADNGGVIFKPPIGLHAKVAEIDFFSMYPNIMVDWNISAETVGSKGRKVREAPGIGAPISQDEVGIVAEILEKVMHKRAEAKSLLESNQVKGYDMKYLKTVYEFLKGIGWVSYGYQGFSGNRIGSIEAHEAINAVSREVILQAKEAAEELDFEVLHVYVDSLFVSPVHDKQKLKQLIALIKARTQLKIDLEGVLEWIVFLPSKQNERVPVPNCYFGVFESGKLKCRGIMARRGDTPELIARAQTNAIEFLAQEREASRLSRKVPELVSRFKELHDQIKVGHIAPEELIVRQTLSRNVPEFKVQSPASRTASTLEGSGRSIHAGQAVEFWRVRHSPYVAAADLTAGPPAELDLDWYCRQLARAAQEVLHCFGISRELLDDWMNGRGTYWTPEDFVERLPNRLPLLALGQQAT